MSQTIHSLMQKSHQNLILYQRIITEVNSLIIMWLILRPYNSWEQSQDNSEERQERVLWIWIWINLLSMHHQEEKTDIFLSTISMERRWVTEIIRTNWTLLRRITNLLTVIVKMMTKSDKISKCLVSTIITNEESPNKYWFKHYFLNHFTRFNNKDISWGFGVLGP